MYSALDKRNSKDIEKRQALLLQKQLQYLLQHSPFYQSFFEQHKIDIANIKTTADLTLIPPTTKVMLADSNSDFLCVEKSEVIDYCTTSGTTGAPVTIALTENDLQRLAENEKRSFECAGISSSDIVQLILTLDKQFMAGMAYFSGLRKLGAGIVRSGPGSPQLQWNNILAYSPTAIVAVPSFIIKLIDYAVANGIDLKNTSVKKAICIGEPLRNADLTDNILARRIKENWDIQLFSTYASTEMQTAFTECGHGKGAHSQPDLIITEVLDDNDQPAAPGQFGELTITTLGIQGLPLLRYRTGDVCCYFNEPCTCGRHSLRLSPVVGRKNQMIKYKGTSIYPQAITNVFVKLPAIKDYLVEVTKNEIGTDELVIHVAVSNDDATVKQVLKDLLAAAVKVVPALNFVDASAIQAMRNTDARKLQSVIFR